jgi:hypothetical protein
MRNREFVNNHKDNTKSSGKNQDWMESDESFNLDKLTEGENDNNNQ